MPDYLSRDDAAKYLRCSLRKIDRLKANGRLPFLKLDGNTLFRKEHLKALPVETAHVKVVTSDASELPSFVRRSTGRAAA